MRAAVFLLVLVLAGCGHRIPAEVRVPVAVPCRVDMPAKPVWATQSLRDDADIFDQVKALLAERRQRIGYERLLEAAIAGCNDGASAATATLSR